MRSLLFLYQMIGEHVALFYHWEQTCVPAIRETDSMRGKLLFVVEYCGEDDMRIVLDTYGADQGAEVFVEGAKRALLEMPELSFLFVGDEEKLTELLQGFPNDKGAILRASDVIDNTDDPISAIRSKPDSSMVVALKELKTGEVDGMLSSGSTGALLAGATLYIGRIKGVSRAALSTLLPSFLNRDKTTMLLDIGANADISPELALTFAKMAMVYSKSIRAISSPTVGLLNIGTEPGKGNQFAKNTFPLLESFFRSNFVGNVEARDLLIADADIVVSDGFTGNIAIKTIEGTAIAMSKLLKEGVYRSFSTKLGGALMKPVFYDLKSIFDSNEYGSAPLLGLRKPVFKAHGSSTARGIETGILTLARFIQEKVVDTISQSLKEEEE